MSADKTITAHIIETGESDFAVSIDVSGHRITGDEPEDAGGKNLGPAPYDLLTAALGECTAMTVRWCALQQKWPLDKVEVNLTFQKINKVGIFEKQVIVHGDQLTDEQRKKLIEIAAKCPVQRTLESKIEIRTLS
ncbi:MAG: OsmC family protein [Alphaproteobacteria bacterium]|nr:OsmC family protein [Alphaproteobacteria bacterium]